MTRLYSLTHSRLTLLLLAGGVIGPPLFIVVFLIEGATRPGYSAWRNYVSDLALSNQGWEQVANFLSVACCLSDLPLDSGACCRRERPRRGGLC